MQIFLPSFSICKSFARNLRVIKENSVLSFLSFLLSLNFSIFFSFLFFSDRKVFLYRKPKNEITWFYLTFSVSKIFHWLEKKRWEGWWPFMISLILPKSAFLCFCTNSNGNLFQTVCLSPVMVYSQSLTTPPCLTVFRSPPLPLFIHFIGSRIFPTWI